MAQIIYPSSGYLTKILIQLPADFSSTLVLLIPFILIDTFSLQKLWIPRTERSHPQHGNNSLPCPTCGFSTCMAIASSSTFQRKQKKQEIEMQQNLPLLHTDRPPHHESDILICFLSFPTGLVRWTYRLIVYTPLFRLSQSKDLESNSHFFFFCRWNGNWLFLKNYKEKNLFSIKLHLMALLQW